MENELIIKDIFTITKKEIIQKAKADVSKAIDSGQVDELQLMQKIKRVSEYAAQVLKELEPEAVMAYEKHGQKTVEYAGAKYSVRPGGKILDYEKDPEYKRLKDELALRKELLDQAYKNNESGQNSMVVDGDGAEVPVVPVKTYRKDSFVIEY
jgi:hypothetical protein